MKFHDDRCKGKAVMHRKPKCGRTDRRTEGRTDGRTDMVIPVYPPNFVAGGIMKVKENFPTLLRDSFDGIMGNTSMHDKNTCTDKFK